MLTETKVFRAPKEGLGITSCEDFAAVSQDGRRFAVADGVSRSYRPDIVAWELVNYFVNAPRELSEPFIDQLKGDYGRRVVERWASRTALAERQALDNGDMRRYRRYVRRREEFGVGAATYAGAVINGSELICETLGDSCLFFIPADRNPDDFFMVPQPDEMSERPAYPFSGEFGSTPACFLSDGRIGGKAQHAVRRLKDGVLLLMTDALSDWFTTHYNTDDEEALNRLLSLENQDDFDRFIAQERSMLALKDDDTTLIIVKLSETDQRNETEECAIDEPHYYPAFPPVLYIDNHERYELHFPPPIPTVVDIRNESKDNRKRNFIVKLNFRPWR